MELWIAWGEGHADSGGARAAVDSAPNRPESGSVFFGFDLRCESWELLYESLQERHFFGL